MMMFHVSKRLLRFAVVSLDRGSSVKVRCSFSVDHRPPYQNQVPFFFLLPHAKQSTSARVEGSPQTTEIKDEVAVAIGHAADEKSWCLPTGNELQRLLPLSISVVSSVLKEPVPLEHALRFFSWACKQPGFAPCTDDVNQIARMWASKYAPFAFIDIEGYLISEGSMYPEATWATLATTSNFLNKPEESVSIFMQSQKHGCVPSQLLYDPFLYALVKCQQLDTALFTMREMLTANIFPGKQVLGSFLDALCKVGKSKDAYKLVHDIVQLSSASFRDAAYSRLISAVWRSVGHSSMALDLLNEMERKGFEPDKQAYTVCVKLLCKKRRYDLAQSLLKHMSERGRSPDTSAYTVLVNGLYRAGNPKEALEVIELLKNEGRPIDRRMRTAFLSCLFAMGRIDDAFNIFEQMQGFGDSLDHDLYYVMIKNLCEIGDIKRAFHLKKTLNFKGFKTDARLYQALQQGLCVGSQYVDELLLLIEELKSNGYSPIAKSYLTLATHFCCLGDYDTARAWAEEMVKKGHKPTPFIKTRFPELQVVVEFVV